MNFMYENFFYYYHYIHTFLANLINFHLLTQNKTVKNVFFICKELHHLSHVSVNCKKLLPLCSHTFISHTTHTIFSCSIFRQYLSDNYLITNSVYNISVLSNLKYFRSEQFKFNSLTGITFLVFNQFSTEHDFVLVLEKSFLCI